VLEAIMQTAEPPLEGLRLCPRHRNDEPRFRDRPADFDPWQRVEIASTSSGSGTGVNHGRAHGQLLAGATEPVADGYVLTVRCPCGVEFMRCVTPGEAARELVLSELLVSGS
jgi:hypothetical protein